MSDFLIDVDAEKYHLDRCDLDALDIVALTDRYHAILEDHTFNIQVVRRCFTTKRYTLVLNGTTYQVDIADQYDQMVQNMGLLATRSLQVNEVRSPMPGLLIEILCSVGQEVEKGTPLLVLSAMKMENIITSPGQGTIKEIPVAITESVEKGQLLIAME